MKALSLFSGIGGKDLAAEWAGITPVAFCEIDPFCRKILKKHWLGVPIFRDVFKLRGYQIGAVDIIYGGFPCQPFSVAGKQKGKSDTRQLWPEFSRLVKEIRPRWVFAENVPGIINIAADDVCADLERLGYEVGIWNFEAAAVGANHRRARIAFIAHLGDSELHGSFASSIRGISNKNDEWCKKGTNISFELEGTGGRKNVETMAHSGRELYEGGVVEGQAGNEDRERNADITQRPSGASSFFPDSDSKRIESRGGECEELGWNTSSKRDSRRSAEPQLGRVDDGVPAWLDRYWWRVEPDIPRTAKGVKDRVNRLKALGNAVVPAWAYLIFKGIVEADGI